MNYIFFVLCLIFLVGCGNNNSNDTNKVNTSTDDEKIMKKEHYTIVIFYNYPSKICLKDEIYPELIYSESYRDSIVVSIENNSISCNDFDKNSICREDTTYTDVGIDNDNLACVVSQLIE